MNKYFQVFCRGVLLFAIVVTLTGCFEKQYSPNIEILVGKYISPEGNFKITKTDNSGLYIIADDNKTAIKMGVLPQYSTTHIRSENTSRSSLKLSSAKYWLDDKGYRFEVRVATDTAKGKDIDGGYVNINGLFVTLPKPLATLDTTIQGGSLKTATVNKIKKGENDVHRFVIAFSLDEDEYEIDVSFHVKLRTEWRFGIAGTGP